MSSYNSQKYALAIGQTANCTITGATDANGLTTTTVTIQSSNSGNADVVGTVSGSTISFSWTAPAGGCDTTIVTWQGNGGQHTIASNPGGFGYVDANGDHVNCGTAPSPDVGITKSDNTSGSVIAGGTFNWVLTITVTNGPTSATVGDTIPAGFSIGSVTDSAASITCGTSTQTVTCSLNATPTGTYTVTIPVTAPSGTPTTNCKQYTNTANITNGGGSNTQNDSASDSVTVLCPAQPDVAISKSDNTSHSVHASGTFNWVLTITVTNGPASATVQDSVPSGFAIGSVADRNSGNADESSIVCNTSTQTVTCSLTNTATGTYTVTIPVTAPDGAPATECTSYQNTATITSGGGTNANNDSANDSVTVTCPDVGVSKSDDTSGTIQAGGSFNWLVSVSVTNGPASATIQDTVPANFIIGTPSANSGTISCGKVGQVVTCTLSSTPTGSYTITIPVTAPSTTALDACASHENDVSITAGGGTNANNDSASDSVTVTCPDVGISKTNNVNGSVAAGGSFNWIIPITVTNGPASATISDTIPAGFTVGTPADQNSGNADEPTISCGAAGQVVTCTLTNTPTGSYEAIIPVTAPAASVDNCKAYQNDASITSGGGTNGNNDSASNSVTVLCPAQPDVGISKTDNTQGSVHAGGGFNWTLTLTVTNGPASATVVDTVPAGFTIGNVSDANSTPADEATIGCSTASQTVTCTLTNTPSGTYTITIPVTAPAATVADACAPHENVANVTVGGGTNANNDSASDAVTVVCPDVGVSKSDDTQGSTHAGGSFNWLVTISVTNGPASATVEDTVPANFTIGSVSANDASISCGTVSQTVTCTLTSTPTGSYTVTIPVTAPAASVDGACANHENDVVVTTGGGTDANNDSASDTVGVVCPDVGVFKSNDAGGSVTAGGTFTWTVTVAVSNGPASGTVQDTVPDGFVIGAISSNEASIDCSAVGQVVTCTLTDTPNGSYAVSIPVTAPSDNPAANCTTYNNTATITDGGGTSSANDSASDPMTVVCPGQAVLSIVKSGDATVVTGGTVSYGVTVTNTSALGANGVVVTDDLPNSLTGVTATYDVDPTTAGGTGTCSVGAGNLVTCNIGALAASDGNTTSPEPDVVQVSISATVTGCATLTNQATVSYSTDGSAQPPTTVDSNIVTTNVTCGSITIVKNAVPNSTQDFGFTGDLGAFTLDDDGNNNNAFSNTVVFNDLGIGTYVVTENVTAGWLVNSITCSDGSSTSVTTRSAVIQLAGGEDVTCTFVNVTDPGTIPPVTPPFTPPVTPPFVPAPANVTTVTALPPIAQVQGAVSIPSTTQPTTPGLISEVEGVRSLPGTGTGGYLNAEGRSGPAGWLILIAAAVSLSFLLLRARRGAR